MRQALRLGRRFVGETAPNPAVGCVIVQGDALVGQGAHERAGTPHAEVHALREAGARARGATAYVTLEPCNHHGRTPPCSEALIDAGVARVVVGTVDPNPRVAGAGIARLRDAGIRVDVGCLRDEADRLIADFRVWQREQRPFVIYKAAATIDGVTARPGIGNWQITSEASRRMVHRLRASCDLVLVGAGTWRADDPD
ncbi:MAG: bifunctional diaminohydroxyphosphoribosylaminopyrimidine deaminase/5-amino-6-(5-phosphoribosylamino)uracil reductase RibD, partial [Candidatus Dadabacteria bacterium]